MTIRPIATFHSPFSTKFGIPRQSGVVPQLKGTICFLPEYRSPDFIRGIEEYDYLWLLWLFSANNATRRGATVRPPLLGGNQSMGVFATRSPYRPNPIGLSSVRVEQVCYDTPDGPVIHVAGADLMDGTPIIDIKPYLEYADCHQDIRSGFTDTHPWQLLQVVIPEHIRTGYDADFLDIVSEVLAQDPRPHFHHDPTRVYGMTYDGHDIRFQVDGGVLTLIEILPKPRK